VSKYSYTSITVHNYNNGLLHGNMEQSTHSYIHSVHSSRSLNGKSTTSRVLKFKKRKYIDPIYDMTF